MEILIKLILGIHITVSLLLIIVVLLQPGKGDIGSVFGGTSESIFGASGAVPFLTKVTRFLAIIFMVTSLSLGYFSARGIRSSVVEDVPSAPVEQKTATVPGKTKNPPKPQTPAKAGTGQGSVSSESKQSQSTGSQKPEEGTKK